MNQQQHLRWLLPLVAAIGLQVSAETQSAKAFEVASIRPHVRGPETGQQPWRVVGNRVDISPVTLRLLISRAFGIPQSRVVGPDWATRELFEIRAIMPTGATDRDALEMLKTLLADRFALKTHMEQRPLPVYGLSIGPSGSKFSEVEAVDEFERDFTKDPGKTSSDSTSGFLDDSVRSITRWEPDGLRYITVTRKTRYSFKQLATNVRQVDAERITMAEFSTLVSQSVDRPVVDMTGLPGIYQFKVLLPPISISPRMQAALGDRISSDPSGAPSLSRVLAELGLKLEPKNSPADFMVIDRIERPTPN